MTKFSSLLLVTFAVAAPVTAQAEENADRRIRFLASRLDSRIPELDKGDSQLPLLLDQLVVLADPPKSQKESDVRKFNIHIDQKLFAKANEEGFDSEKVQIKLRYKHMDVPLSTVLELICGQLDAGYTVRNDCIEIVPIQFLRKELNYHHGPDSELRNLVVRFYDSVSVQSAFNDLAEKYNRNVILSPLIQKELEQNITAHLLNVPFDVAVESLADMADLKIVRKGNVALVTNHAQASALKAEYEKRQKMERERSDLPKTRFPFPWP